jgi:N utilization substance protein B
MISRRNIRVKVMQTLYAMDSMEANQVRPGTATSLLKDKLDQTCQIFSYILYSMTRVAQYAELDAQAKANKHLPSAADLAVNTKIAANDYVIQILNDRGFLLNLDSWKLKRYEDPEITRKLYKQLAESSNYKQYIDLPNRSKTSEKGIMEYIFREILDKNDVFRQHMEDHFISWGDDADMMGILVSNYLSKPHLFNFIQLISQEKLDYGKELLATVLDKRSYCMDFIKPRLQNWDPERIASIDMLLMEMGVCEFLYFPTIPTKVTINEYIDLAKAYSTNQSGQFVNGILDNILKDLQKANLIQKSDRDR